MENARLETAVTEVSGVPVVTASGEIDVYTAPDFKTAINQPINSGATSLVIDLTNVSYMDSSGFGALLGVTKRVRPKGGAVHLVGCSDAITRMLKITRLDTVFGLFADLDEAIAAIKQAGQLGQ